MTIFEQQQLIGIYLFYRQRRLRGAELRVCGDKQKLIVEQRQRFNARWQVVGQRDECRVERAREQSLKADCGQILAQKKFEFGKLRADRCERCWQRKRRDGGNHAQAKRTGEWVS